MSHDELVARTGQLIRDTLGCGPVPITCSTRAADVRGWDSLSHTMVLLRIEDAFGIRLPLQRVLEITNVGDLVAVVASQIAAKGLET